MSMSTKHMTTKHTITQNIVILSIVMRDIVTQKKFSLLHTTIATIMARA